MTLQLSLIVAAATSATAVLGLLAALVFAFASMINGFMEGPWEIDPLMRYFAVCAGVFGGGALSYYLLVQGLALFSRGPRRRGPFYMAMTVGMNVFRVGAYVTMTAGAVSLGGIFTALISLAFSDVDGHVFAALFCEILFAGAAGYILLLVSKTMDEAL